MSPVLTTLKTDDINRLNNARSHTDGGHMLGGSSHFFPIYEKLPHLMAKSHLDPQTLHTDIQKSLKWHFGGILDSRVKPYFAYVTCLLQCRVQSLCQSSCGCDSVKISFDPRISPALSQTGFYICSQDIIIP